MIARGLDDGRAMIRARDAPSMEHRAPRAPRTVRRRHGDAAEEHAARYLGGAGWRVLSRNVVVGRDEIDLIAVDPGPPETLVFVEVRSRVSLRFGAPEETIGQDKARRLYRAALAIVRGPQPSDGPPLPRLPWRVDLVVVDDRAVRSSAEGSIRHTRGLAPD